METQENTLRPRWEQEKKVLHAFAKVLTTLPDALGGTELKNEEISAMLEPFCKELYTSVGADGCSYTDVENAKNMVSSVISHTLNRVLNYVDESAQFVNKHKHGYEFPITEKPIAVWETERFEIAKKLSTDADLPKDAAGV